MIALDAKFTDLCNPISIAFFNPKDSLYCEFVHDDEIPNSIYKYLWKIKSYRETVRHGMKYYYGEKQYVEEKIKEYINKHPEEDYIIYRNFEAWVYFNSLFQKDNYNPIIFEYAYKHTFHMPLNSDVLNLQRLSGLIEQKQMENALDVAEMIYYAYDRHFS